MEKVTPEELIHARMFLNLSIAEMAETLKTPYSTYYKWEKGERRIPGLMRPALSVIIKYRVKHDTRTTKK